MSRLHYISDVLICQDDRTYFLIIVKWTIYCWLFYITSILSKWCFDLYLRTMVLYILQCNFRNDGWNYELINFIHVIPLTPVSRATIASMATSANYTNQGRLGAKRAFRVSHNVIDQRQSHTKYINHTNIHGIWTGTLRIIWWKRICILDYFLMSRPY